MSHDGDRTPPARGPPPVAVVEGAVVADRVARAAPGRTQSAEAERRRHPAPVTGEQREQVQHPGVVGNPAGRRLSGLGGPDSRVRAAVCREGNGVPNGADLQCDEAVELVPAVRYGGPPTPAAP